MVKGPRLSGKQENPLALSETLPVTWHKLICITQELHDPACLSELQNRTTAFYFGVIRVLFIKLMKWLGLYPYKSKDVNIHGSLEKLILTLLILNFVTKPYCDGKNSVRSV